MNYGFLLLNKIPHKLLVMNNEKLYREHTPLFIPPWRVWFLLGNITVAFDILASPLALVQNQG